MDGQLVLAALAVAGSLLYLGRRTWRTWSSKAGCGGGCGCRPSAGTGAAPREGLISAEQLTARARQEGRRGSGG